MFAKGNTLQLLINPAVKIWRNPRKLYIVHPRFLFGDIVMDNRGQAFDSFKLLIAAIVAIAILGVLMPIIAQIGGFIPSDPTASIARQLTNTINSPGTLKVTEKLTFSRDVSNISAKAIANEASISPDQICFSLGAYAERGFTIMGEGKTKSIVWNGSGTITVKAYVICDTTKEDLAASVESYITDEDVSLDNCDGCGTDKCCAVILKSSN